MRARTLALMLEFADADAALVLVREGGVVRARASAQMLARDTNTAYVERYRWVHMVRGISHLPVAEFPALILKSSPKRRARLTLVHGGKQQ